MPANWAVYDCMWEKADVRKGYWNPKRNLGVTIHFSETVKLQFWGKMSYIVMYFDPFGIIVV